MCIFENMVICKITLGVKYYRQTDEVHIYLNEGINVYKEFAEHHFHGVYLFIDIVYLTVFNDKAVSN